MSELLAEVDAPVYVYAEAGRLSFSAAPRRGQTPIATASALDPAQLGAASFLRAHDCALAYVAGAMAGGISSTTFVRALAAERLLSFFGSGGLELSAVEHALSELSTTLGVARPWGLSFLADPGDPARERALADLALRYRAPCVDASAFAEITPALVLLRGRGLLPGPDGAPRPARAMFAKLSRPALAREFMTPAPREIVASLVASGALSPAEAELLAKIPLADDIVAEGSSGGHTDGLPTLALLSAFQAERRALGSRTRIGAAGGLGTPEAVAGTFAAGADFVVTGSVNQSSVEASTSALVKRLLAEADVHDVAFAPAADMLELGAKVQVLARGTLFARRATMLGELYQAMPSWEAIPEATRSDIEARLFRASAEEVYREVSTYFGRVAPERLAKAERDPKLRLALLFRWYLGMSSRWAREGREDRVTDFQVWCGPAMGAFNRWVRGSFLEPPSGRTAAEIALNLMRGAAVLSRIQELRIQGVRLTPEASCYEPRPLCNYEGVDRTSRMGDPR